MDLSQKMDHLQLQVSLDAMFDVQIKRIHEYKRQLLNILSIIHRYDCIKVFELCFKLTDTFTKDNYLATCSECLDFSSVASPVFNIFLSL